MKKYIRILLAVVAGLAAVVVISACASKASTVSHNLSTEADNFQITRSVTFYNGITGKAILVIQGLCSLGSGTGSTDLSRSNLTVTCKVGPNKYIKDFLGLSDNVTYVAQQVISANVSDSHYKVIWRPETLIPGISIQ